MRQFKTKEELAEWIKTMQLQNTDDREEDMFLAGINAAITELVELNLFALPLVSVPKGTVCEHDLYRSGKYLRCRKCPYKIFS